MDGIAATPAPPYYAVIFTSRRAADLRGYAEMADEMELLAARQPGFLGLESTGEKIGITVSYWRDLESIRRWKNEVRHREAQRRGREQWYADYRVRVARVEREYGRAAAAAEFAVSGAAD
ncbi:MAG: antibiotic biosynthesis monooxygenase family protein [Gammaproteobacteria bacterium]